MAQTRGQLTVKGFPEMLRGALRHSGLTLDTVQRRLAQRGVDVGRSTLSAWQMGRRSPSGPRGRAAVVELERVLRLPPGMLTDALDGTPTSTDPYSTITLNERLGALMREIGCDVSFGLTEAAAFIAMARFGARGELLGLQNLYTIRALADIDRYPLLEWGEPGGDPSLINVQIVSGGRVGRSATHAESNLAVFEVVLDRELRRGDTHLIHYLVSNDNAQVSEGHTILIDTPRTFVLLEARFHEARLPVRVEEFEKLSEEAPDVMSRDISLSREGTVAIVRDRGRPGVLGLRLTWA